MKTWYTLTLLPLLLLVVSLNLDAQNLVAHYPFDGNIQDASENNNDATAKAVQLTQDRFGVAARAALFDGDQSALTAPVIDPLLSDFTTVSLWVKANSLPDQGEVYLISLGGWQDRWKVSLPSHGKPIWTTNADMISDMDAGDGNELVVGEWTHLVFVHDGTKDIVYVNGEEANSKDVAGALNETTRKLGIGFDPISNDFTFDGAIDEVMIFDAAMSASQVATLFQDQSTAEAIPDQLVASYSFDGNLADGTEFNNTASANNVDFSTDRHGFGNSAVVLQGDSSSFITAPNSAQLNSDLATVAMWVKVHSLPAQGEVYIASFGGWQERWKISLPGHGKPVWTTKTDNQIADLDSGDGNALVPGEWTHLVVVHDGEMDLIYMDGTKVAERAAAGDLTTTTQPLGLGYNPIDNANFFDGELDEVKIYNYALSAQEIQDLYDAEADSGVDPNLSLVADFPIMGNADDASPFGNDGLVHGAMLTQDRFGYGASAYEISDGNAITVDNSPQYNSDFTTVSMWVKPNELPAQGEVFLISFGGWQERFKVSLPSHGKPVWTTNADAISDMDSGDGNTLLVDIWTHLAFVHDGTKDKIFMNGVLAAEKDVAGPLNDTDEPLGIGYNPFGNDLYFKGDVDQIQIHNEALSDQEIADLFAAQNMAPTFNETLVAYYPFRGNANDVTPFKNNAEVDGAVLTDDRFDLPNRAYDFNGTDASITADNSTQLNSPLVSVSFWAKVDQLPEQGEMYLASHGGWQERWKISLPNHGKPVWTTKSADDVSDMDSGDENVLEPGVWSHWVMVHDGTKDKIYKDGQLTAEKDVAGNLNETTHDLGIGYNPIDDANYFDGAIDEFQVYNVALTDEQIAALYAEQSTAPVESDTVPPTAPLDLMAEVIFTDVNLSWRASTDNSGSVAGYNVYQDSVKIATITTTKTSILGLPQLTMFTFGVSAIDSTGNESTITTIMVTTGTEAAPDTLAPSVPTNLAVSAGPNSVVFSWDPSTDDRAVAGYIVLVDGEFIDSLEAGVTSILIDGLEAETAYTFEVAAFDLAGNLSAYADITESTTAPLVTDEEGLVAHYPFDGDANDVTPYANHGVIGGDPVFENVVDRLNPGGQAIVFDGDRDSVLAPNAIQLNSDFTTVSFWIRVDGQNLEDAEAYVLDFGHWNQRWKISLPQHLKIVWTTNSMTDLNDNLISDMDSGDGNELVKDFWWYVTMVHDGVDDIIYLDGKEVNRKPAPGTLNVTARPLGMGNNPIEGGQYFTGALDELKIYNRALTASEVDQLYNTGTTGVKELRAELRKHIRSVYPNPVVDEITVEHRFTGNENIIIRIFDASGRQVDGYRVSGADLGGGKLTLPLGEYPTGLYQMNFVANGRNLGALPFVRVK